MPVDPLFPFSAGKVAFWRVVEGSQTSTCYRPCATSVFWSSQLKKRGWRWLCIRLVSALLSLFPVPAHEVATKPPEGAFSGPRGFAGVLAGFSVCRRAGAHPGNTGSVGGVGIGEKAPHRSSWQASTSSPLWREGRARLRPQAGQRWSFFRAAVICAKFMLSEPFYGPKRTENLLQFPSMPFGAFFFFFRCVQSPAGIAVGNWALNPDGTGFFIPLTCGQFARSRSWVGW